MQAELLEPDRFPYIIIPEDQDFIDESPPEIPELEECVSKLKNGSI